MRNVPADANIRATRKGQNNLSFSPDVSFSHPLLPIFNFYSRIAISTHLWTGIPQADALEEYCGTHEEE